MGDNQDLSKYQDLKLTVHITDKGVLLEMDFGLLLSPPHWEKLQEGIQRGFGNLSKTIEDHNRFVYHCKVTDEDRPGYVYVVKAASGEYKIGHTNSIPRRLSDFGLQLPFPVELVFAIPADDRYSLERHLHERFADLRMHGEWFNLTDADIASIRAMCEAAQIDLITSLP